MTGSIIKTGIFNGWIDFGTVRPDSKEARLYPIAVELLDSVKALEAELQRLKGFSLEVFENVDERVIDKARALVQAAG